MENVKRALSSFKWRSGMLKKIIGKILSLMHRRKTIKRIQILLTLWGIPIPKKLLNCTDSIQSRLYRSPINLDKLYVLTTITYEFTLLPHFINYYKNLGVKNFIIAVSNSIIPDLRERLTLYAKTTEGIVIVPTSGRLDKSGYEGADKEEIRRTHIEPSSWIIPVDLDEFVQYPDTLCNLMHKISNTKATNIRGIFADRIAVGGVLTQDNEDISLFDQFPLEAEVTKMLPKAGYKKVTLCYGEVPLGVGAHKVLDGSEALPFCRSVIHHFKWRAGLIPMLRKRQESYSKSGVVWLKEVDNVLNYLQKKGRIIPEEFNAKQGWRPNFSTIMEEKILKP